MEALKGVRIRIFDSDEVEVRNVSFQHFGYDDIGKKKVEALRDSLAGCENEFLEIEACPYDIRSPSALGECHIVVVCVDSSEARRVVHSSSESWADIRCAGDGFIAIDHRVADSVVESLTTDQEPKSCQLEGALETGNVQMGFLASAAWGVQWVVQTLRQMAGEGNAMPPLPTSTSITFGTMGRLPLKEAPTDE